MKKIYYKKLIRNKIPKRIEESNGKYLCKKLNSEEFKNELLKKVQEESLGIVVSKNKKELVSEIGDVLDVIDEIKKNFKITSKEIVDSRKIEFERKGGLIKDFFWFGLRIQVINQMKKEI